ncbi:MAG: STAS domain-containing protein [Lachnospiraceae bacterium]|nr:STAS domain-containing protein [Candidatus Minthocola equi]
MEITKTVDNGVLNVALAGRLDTTTAPELEAALKDEYANCSGLILNFENLEYISSAGLRVLLAAQKATAACGGVLVRGANEEIKEVFDITGFSDILNIE